MSDAATTPSTATKLVAEALGTFLLVFGAIGTALVAGEVVGVLGISLAFGLTILAGIYAWGPISGGHFNPAVTVGLAAAGRFAWKDAPGYIIAQIIGGALGTTLIVLIGLFGPEGWLTAAQDGGFASNGFGGASPGGFGLGAAIIAEILFTAIFVLIILGVTHPQRGTAGFAGIAIGLTLTLIHLASIPIDNTSVNPARSIATALYGGGEALLQLWVFLVFPIVGALVAGLLHRALFEPKGSVPPAPKEARVK
ncbi:aquaporin [Microbacterium aurantiacum]|uniref:Aquaporin n=1 Tax=Microbacterium aurantiacum TaxID=162393 RepID=A0AAJ2HIP5_9MICO|nr:aquaporin [Microbacterium aurantiacum]MDS0246916.1 aquaporin [Microbacterium aurantiacum]